MRVVSDPLLHQLLIQPDLLDLRPRQYKETIRSMAIDIAMETDQENPDYLQG